MLNYFHCKLLTHLQTLYVILFPFCSKGANNFLHNVCICILGRGLAGIVGSTPTPSTDVSLASVVCCQVEVSATD
jgi:hypothetical protein